MFYDVISVIVYFAIGLILFALGYKMFDVLTPFDLQKELDNHNLGAGLAVGGMFIGIAIIVGGVILT